MYLPLMKTFKPTHMNNNIPLNAQACFFSLSHGTLFLGQQLFAQQRNSPPFAHSLAFLAFCLDQFLPTKLNIISGYINCWKLRLS
jgi:hypothetical protein